MPSTATITSFYSFTAATKARSSEVNNNFGVFRGHILPVNTDTATASDLIYNLGSDTHRWDVGYLSSIDFNSSTNTSGLVLQGQTTDTNGAFEFLIGGSTAAVIDPDGIRTLSTEFSSAKSNVAFFQTNPAFNVWQTITTLSLTSSKGNSIEFSFKPSNITDVNTASDFYIFSGSTGTTFDPRFMVYRDTIASVIYHEKRPYQRTTTTASDNSNFLSYLSFYDHDSTSGAAHTYYLMFKKLGSGTEQLNVRNYDLIAKETIYNL